MQARSKPFRKLVRQRAAADAQFAEALRREGVAALQSGDADAGQIILCGYLQDAASNEVPVTEK